jgi:hypothetical protein
VAVYRSTAALLACLTWLLLAGAPASAAERIVPHGFFGVHLAGELSAATWEVQDAQWDLMAASGVESVRADFTWAHAQRREGAPFDLGVTDEIVRRASYRGIKVLPVVNNAPPWARAYPRRANSPPRRAREYAAYVRALLERYGPNGSLWIDYPQVPKRPLREWQIWNEPHLRLYWNAPPASRWGHPHGYGVLLRAAYKTIKSIDPGANVVLAGLTQRAWEELAAMYADGGIRNHFDVAALQVFPQTVRRAALASALFRRALDKGGDRDAEIYLTELSWPASRGRTTRVRYLANETPRSMAHKLASAYDLLARKRRALRLRAVYWYTWASPYGRGGSVFNYSGLLARRGEEFSAQPALAAFQRKARQLQGCVKTSLGVCESLVPAGR